MFPLDFALSSISEHTRPGQAVLDPFMGRGTTLAAAAALGRPSTGIEINQIAWIYASVKTNPAPVAELLSRLTELECLLIQQELPLNLSEFFTWAFHPEVLRFLLVARDNLNWRECLIDRTLMALLLVDLHGKDSESFSNQMRQTKSMSPDYAVQWWKRNYELPRYKQAAQLLRKKIAWRYQSGLPNFKNSANAIHGDSTIELMHMQPQGKFDFLLTSPPYLGVINYHYDQWLRGWLLGGPMQPTSSGGRWQNRFTNPTGYKELLNSVFLSASTHLTPTARILVRTDAREATLKPTIEVLESIFPDKKLSITPRPFKSQTQTHLFGDKAVKPGEIDLLLT
jgi:hypothetical protein